ncbi:hypothetical protein GON01_06705 [Sphingomonas sp. MAH-20]|uniref:Uncharacterized protein n=1 Tax=Sphingomonas horti TaxID=2682842 RepID=A0A6I4J023_9SPHN|nr:MULTISPECIES: hypothetical protein [Sphingomonas]MBA2920688.1 hypothetical protein [Sphingomonas sp. CGMCC 1.13658]MVO77624.1 hypothetical protein [Sphingomonas horti]
MPSIVRRAALLGFVVALTGNTGPALTGQWGAPGANLIVGADGARIEQECAGGSFASATPGADGRFTAKGRYESYGPGPQRADETAAANATFEGRLQGDTLRLTIRPANGTPQQLTLLRGKRAKLIRCY